MIKMYYLFTVLVYTSKVYLVLGNTQDLACSIRTFYQICLFLTSNDHQVNVHNQFWWCLFICLFVVLNLFITISLEVLHSMEYGNTFHVMLFCLRQRWLWFCFNSLLLDRRVVWVSMCIDCWEHVWSCLPCSMWLMSRFILCS